MSMILNLDLPRLHAGQQRCVHENRRFNVLCMGRRWGKSTFGLQQIIAAALEGRPAAWMSPTYKMLSEVWRSAKRTLREVTASVNTQEKRIELLSGGVIDFWSLENADAIRGRKYALMVVDEAAMVGELQEIWQLVLRPTLTDYRGGAWLLSTPKGRNFFWSCWMLGQEERDPEWRSWQMPTASNPYIAPEEIAAAQRELPEKVFSQEYLAQFLDDSSSVFRRVLAAATAVAQEAAVDGHGYIFGVDWARQGDFSVISVLDVTMRQQVAMERFNQVDYEIQVGRLQGLYDRFVPQLIIAEQNSIGVPLLEKLQRLGLPVQPFVTSNASKMQIIDGLALAFERGDLQILNDPVQIAELQGFGMERLPSGLVRYGAPSSLHDDTVMALAIGYSGLGRPNPTQLVDFV